MMGQQRLLSQFAIPNMEDLKVDNHAYPPNRRKPVPDSVFAVTRATGQASP